MSNWRERFARWFQGRYGANDTLNKWLLGAFLMILVLALLLQSNLLNLLSVLVLAYAYFRIFSRNIEKRAAENRKFLEIKSSVLSFFRGGDRTHRVFSCPNCGQKVRVPRGHGKISITCPKCHTEFVKRS